MANKMKKILEKQGIDPSTSYSLANVAKQALYHLSYIPVIQEWSRKVDIPIFWTFTLKLSS